MTDISKREARAIDLLREEVEQLKSDISYAAGRRVLLDKRIKYLEELLLDIANSGVEIELRQYTTVQISGPTWDAIQVFRLMKEST